MFVCVRMVGYSDLVAEIERNLRNADAVVRFQTVRLDTVVEALDKVTVDPDQVKFARIEAPSPDEVEPTVEERLGLNVKSVYTKKHRLTRQLRESFAAQRARVASPPPAEVSAAA